MRILVTVPWGERLGGAETMLHSLVQGAGDAGYELELIFFDDGPWPAELRDAGFDVTVVPAGRMRHLHRWVPTVVRLVAAIRRAQPDVILNWSAKTHLYGSPAAALAGMKDRVAWWQHFIPDGGWFDRCATVLPASAIGCSSHAAAHAQARLRPSRPTFVVHPGVSMREPAASTPHIGLDIPSDATIVGIVGRLQPWKGQDRLLRAHAVLRARGHRLHTLIVGGDAYGLSPEYAASIPTLIGELQLDGEVTMTGQVDDARPYILHMDVLVNASDPEPFGIVLLEGMAAAVPVVAVNSAGPAELLEGGRTGILARSGQPNDLADALEPLVAFPELRKRVGGAGHEHFVAEFTDAAMSRRFVNELERVVQGHAFTRRDSRVRSRSHPEGGTLERGAQIDADDRAAPPQ